MRTLGASTETSEVLKHPRLEEVVFLFMQMDMSAQMWACLNVVASAQIKHNKILDSTCRARVVMQEVYTDPITRLRTILSKAYI